MASVMRYMSCVTLFISIVFGIIALGAPNWSHIQRMGSGAGSRGLWMNCFTVDSTCYDKSRYMYMTEWYDFEKITAGFYLGAVVCILIGLVLCLCSVGRYMDTTLAGAFAIFSGVCSLISLSVWAGMQKNKMNSGQVVLSWAYILAVMQCITALVGGIFCIVDSFLARREGKF